MKSTTRLLAMGAVPTMMLGAACSPMNDAPLDEARQAHELVSGNHRHPETGPAPGALAATLIRDSDLPPAYTEGAHHGSTSGPPPQIRPGCAPIADILATDHRVHQHDHAQERVEFSKSHYGPTLYETVIDYGTPAAATRAIESVEQAGERCHRYEQSTSRAGANLYAVRPAPSPVLGHDGTAMRLTAVGHQFRDLHWDVWLTQSHDRVAAVAFRSVPGGDNDDWPTASVAAAARLHG